jgi:endoglucanase
MSRPSTDRTVEVVSTLCDLPGPGGHEGPVRSCLEGQWADHVSSLRADPVGNLLARVGEGAGPRVLIDAHMDEIAYRVRAITPDGFLLLHNAQGSQRDPQERRYMVGNAAQVLRRGEVVARGVFAAPSGHILSAKLLQEGHLGINDFFVDLGCGSAAEVEERGVHIGAAVIFDATTRRLGSRLVGKAMDDRMLLAVMTLLAEQLDPAELTVDLWLGATIQEENGLHGAFAISATERFDAVICLDVGLTGDIPVIAPGDVAPRLGGGPIVLHGDRGVHYDGKLTWDLIESAEAAAIPFQHGSFGDYSSDGTTYMNAGMPTALIATPTRYTHTAIEMTDIADVQATVALLHAYVTRPRD